MLNVRQYPLNEAVKTFILTDIEQLVSIDGHLDEFAILAICPDDHKERIYVSQLMMIRMSNFY